MVLTVIIILALVFTFVSYFPVTGLLTKAGIDDFKFASKSSQAAEAQVEEISSGEIVFELRAKKYSSFATNAKGEISVKGKTIAEGNGVSADTNSLIKIEGYYGSFDLDGQTVSFNGSVAKLVLPDATFKTDNIILTSTAETLNVKNIETKNLRITGVLGTIKVRETEIAFTGTLVLTDAVAELNLQDELIISGKAASVEIPEAGLRFK